jgi:hypothetical protein
MAMKRRSGSRLVTRPQSSLIGGELHVVASARREPATIRAEGEAGKLQCIVAELGEERARGGLPDVRHLALEIDRGNELAIK